MSVVLVCGPPCAGKTTYALEHAGPDTLVVDHDLIAQRLGSTLTHNHTQDVRKRAEREVTRLLKEIERGQHPDAIVVRTMGDPAKRQALADRLGAELVLLVPDDQTLKARAQARPDPTETLQAIDAWYTTSSRAPLTPRDPAGQRTGAINTRAWRVLRDRVVREEPTCWLQFPGICTKVSTTADHVLTRSSRPDLAMVRSNLRGACEPCNRARNKTPIEALRHDTDQPPALKIFD